MDMLLTGCIIGLLGIVVLLGVKKADGVKTYWGNDYIATLRTICCIVVVMVHFPIEYSNKLQDIIGSFAYICVTLFFMISAYGLKWSIQNKPNYLQHFWKNRIVSLLIPMIFVNIFSLVINIFIKQGIDFKTLLFINHYIYAILVCYFLFYICYKFLKFKDIYKDIIIIAIIVIGSLLTKLTSLHIFFIWPTESMGFVWGILLARYINKIYQWSRKNNMIKVIILLVISVGMGVLYLKTKHIFFAGDYIIKIILGLIIVIFILIITTPFKFGNKISKYISGISYEIYLIHGVIIDFLIYIGLTHPLSSGIFIVLTYIITIICSIIIQRISGFLIKIIKN